MAKTYAGFGATDRTVWAIIADGTFDQICETPAQAAKEKRDLEKMGCTVRIRAFTRDAIAEAWAAAEAYEAKLNG